MKIQLALDRVDIKEGIRLAGLAEAYIDWIEVGTSLIKEFGVTSIKEIKKAFPDKVVVADMKTIDNARYEFEMCYKAGADIATVMGASPLVTIEACQEVARSFNKKVMIDLLNTSQEQTACLVGFKDAILCDHVSKDEQEITNAKNDGMKKITLYNNPTLELAVAGGITLDTLPILKKNLNPSVVIIGSAITKASDPRESARQFRHAIKELEEK